MRLFLAIFALCCGFVCVPVAAEISAAQRSALASRCEKYDAQCFWEVGEAYRDISPVDLALAAQFLTKACEINFYMACGEAAVLYQDGRGVKRDQITASNLAKRGCDYGDKPSCQVMYHSSPEPLQAPGGKSNITFNKLCFNGDANACLIYARTVFRNSNRVARHEIDVAILAYRRACDADIATACKEIGIEYYNGKIAGVDLNFASYFLGNACRLGDRDSCAYQARVGNDMAGARPRTSHVCTGYGQHWSEFFGRCTDM